MNSLVLYDSNFGQTELIARAVAGVLNARLKNVRTVKPVDLEGVSLLVVGSPINAWSPLPTVKTFLKDTGPLNGINVAAFDTRMKSPLSGNAARKIMKLLLRKGGHEVASPQGFFVKGKEGPLAEGELERSKNWAKNLLS